MMQVVNICNEAIVRQQEAHSSQEHGKIDPMVTVIWNRFFKHYAQKSHTFICANNKSQLETLSHLSFICVTFQNICILNIWLPACLQSL